MKELEILYLKEKIQELKNELPMLCDSDYYNQCDLIEQYEQQLEKELNSLKIGGNNVKLEN